MTKLNLLFIISIFGTLHIDAQIEEKKEEKERDFQISFITPLGTNGIGAPKITNRVSVNILAGVAQGVNGIEVGGLANVILKDVKGIQAAGFSNVVLGNIRGAQFAGFTNVNGGNIEGGQFAGFCNVSLGKQKGLQLAGFSNYNHKDLKGLQAAGFTNVTLGNFHGAQLAGFGNVSLGNMEGVQAAGFFNYAKKVKGIQLGFINIADSVDGISIGFLSLVRKGLHQVEISADELFYTNLSVRTGGYGFYNVLNVGLSPNSGTTLWNIGYGIGTSFKLNNKMRSDITISAHHVSKGLFYQGTSELYKIYIGLEYKLGKKCFIAAGPTFNLYFSDTLLPDYGPKYSNVAPYSMLNETNLNGFNFKGWIGGRLSIRFL